MRYCRRCIYPENHPLNLTFDAEGVCSGCRVHEEKDRLDWNERGLRLGGIFDGYRSRSRIGYDCIVPVSGARDSYFVVHTVKKLYGMNPLLVSYNRHYNTRRGIRNLAYLRTLLDCDMVDQTVGLGTVKAVTRATLERLGSMYWHVLAGQTVFPVQVAVRLKIPLIVWGAHQGCDQVGMFSHLDEVEMTRKYRKEHDLMGLEAEDLVDVTRDLPERDLLPYFYPHDKELERVGVRGIYLSNYIRWDTKAFHERMLDAYGYETAPLQRTFDPYNDVDCVHYAGLHDYLKFLKWGYGKATDHACREIRLRRLTREEAIDLVSRYEAVEPRDAPAFLDWIGMTRAELPSLLEPHRDARAWEATPGGGWTLRDSIRNHRDDPGVEAARLGTIGECSFRITPNKEPEADETRPVLHARGWVDAVRYE